MKYRFFLAAALLGILSVRGAESPGGMLTNASFEELKDGRPAGWRIIRYGLAGDTHKTETETVLDGTHAVSLENTDPRGTGMLIWGQSVPAGKFNVLPAGTWLELSAWVRAEGKPAQAKIYFESVKARKTIVKRRLISPGNWEKIVLKFEKGKIDYLNSNVYLQLEGKGKIIFDKVFFGPTAKPEYAKGSNLIANPGAEQQDAKGVPVLWKQIKHQPEGKLFSGENGPGSGKASFGFSCPVNPIKPLGWGIRLEGADFAGIAPQVPMTISFDLTTFANPAVQVRCYAEFMDEDRFIGTFGGNFSVYAGWERKSFTFPMPGRKFTHCWVYFMLKTEGKACVDNVAFKQEGSIKKHTVSDDYCRVKDIPPRRTWIAPEKPEKLELEFKLSGPELTVSLAEINGKTLKTWKLDSIRKGKVETRTITLPALREGAYVLDFESGALRDCEWFALRKNRPAGVHFTRDRYMVFKGKPVFPIAMAHPNLRGDSGLDGLRVYSESGINMISEYEIAGKAHAEYLNAMCNQFGFMLWLKEEFGARPHQRGEALRRHIEKLAGLAKLIDNFAGFQSDEAAWNLWPLESVRRHSMFRFKYAPDYYTWQCNAPRMTDKTGNPRSSFDVVRRYALAADVTGADIYPVPEGKASHNNLPNQTLSCVGDYTDLVRKMVWDDRPVWMVLQAMSWREERLEPPNSEWPRPTKDQLRFMVWNAVTHGATGICWYGHGAWTDQYSEWYRQFAEVNLELAAAAKIMLSGKTEAAPAVPEKVGVLARTGIRVFVNESGKKEADIDVTGTWFICPTGEAFRQGRHTLKPYEVLILTAQPLKLAPVKRFERRKTTLTAATGVEQTPVLIDGEWVAHPQFLKGGEKTLSVRQKFVLPAKPKTAVLRLAADDSAAVSVNGRPLSEECVSHFNVNRFNISSLLKQGENVIECRLLNKFGYCGLVFDLNADGTVIRSGKETQISLDGKNWVQTRCCGKPPTSPWGKPTLLTNHPKQ